MVEADQAVEDALNRQGPILKILKKPSKAKNARKKTAKKTAKAKKPAKAKKRIKKPAKAKKRLSQEEKKALKVKRLIARRVRKNTREKSRRCEVNELYDQLADALP